MQINIYRQWTKELKSHNEQLIETYEKLEKESCQKLNELSLMDKSVADLYQNDIANFIDIIRQNKFNFNLKINKHQFSKSTRNLMDRANMLYV